MRSNRIAALAAVAAIVAIQATCDSTSPPAAPMTSVGFVCIGDPTVSPPTIKMFIGDTAVVTMHMGCADQSSSLTWRSSNMAVALVDSVRGVIRALAVGSATVTATLVSNPAVSGSAVVQVNSR